MFVFKKLVTPFLLPPGMFIVCLMLSCLWFVSRRNWKAGIVNFFIGSLMWFFSIAPVGNAFLRGLESNYGIPVNVRGDVIVLLGGSVNGEAPDLSGYGVPSEAALGRLVTAVRLQKKLKIPIIVSSGKVFEHGTAEALILRRFLVDLGVPAKKIIMEQSSRDTFENAKYTRQICDRFGYKKPVLVTSSYHMHRSVLSFKKAGMEVTPFPASFKTWQGQEYGWNSYLPGTFKKVSVALKEYLGLAFFELAYPKMS
jgi:uncharacterized SAM-binding protein YcdF (DUF218 family)